MADEKEEEVQITDEQPAAPAAAPKPKGPSRLNELFFQHGEKIGFVAVLVLSLAGLAMFVILPSDSGLTGQAQGLQSTIDIGSDSYGPEIAEARAALERTPPQRLWATDMTAQSPALPPWSSALRTRIDVTTEARDAVPVPVWHPAVARVDSAAADIGVITVTVVVTAYAEHDDDPEQVDGQLIRRQHRSDPVEALLLQRRTLASDGSTAEDWAQIEELVVGADGTWPAYADSDLDPKTTYEYRVGIRGRNIPAPQSWSNPEGATTPDIFSVNVIGLMPSPGGGQLVRMTVHRIQPDGTDVTVRASHAQGHAIGCTRTEDCGSPFHEHDFVHTVDRQPVEFNTGLTLTTVRQETRRIPWLQCPRVAGGHEIQVDYINWDGTVIQWSDADGNLSDPILMPQPHVPDDQRCAEHSSRPVEEILRELGEQP